MTDTFIELADRYYDRKMTAEERAEVESRLQDDAGFAEQMESYREARQAVAIWSDEEQKARFRRRYAEQSDKQASSAKVVPLSRRTWLYAVAAAVILLVAVFLGRNGQQMSPEDIFQQRFDMPVLSGARDANVDTVPVMKRFQQANAWYLAGQYDSVLVVMPDVVRDPGFDRQASAWLHIGMSHYGLGQEAEALNALEKVPAASPLVHDARWYRALILLKQQDVEGAKALFRQLDEESRSYGKDAREILDQLGE